MQFATVKPGKVYAIEEKGGGFVEFQIHSKTQTIARSRTERRVEGRYVNHDKSKYSHELVTIDMDLLEGPVAEFRSLRDAKAERQRKYEEKKKRDTEHREEFAQKVEALGLTVQRDRDGGPRGYGDCIQVTVPTTEGEI